MIVCSNFLSKDSPILLRSDSNLFAISVNSCICLLPALRKRNPDKFVLLTGFTMFSAKTTSILFCTFILLSFKTLI